MTPIRESLQRVMAEKCSVFRNHDGLTDALSEIQKLKKRYTSLKVANQGRKFNYELQEALELGNMLVTAEVIAFSALRRHESRGAHFRQDFHERNDSDWLKHTLVSMSKDGLKLSYRPVVLSRFLPEKRRY